MDPLMESIRQFLMLDENDETMDAEIAKWTPHHKLDIFLTWNGLLGYTNDIISVMEELGWSQDEG